MSDPKRPRTAPLVDHRQPRPGEVTFDALREAALEVVQERATTWTDHNLHDPGITLLEAGLWGVADLLYRVEAFPESAVPEDLRGAATLPAGLSVGARLLAAQALLDRFGDLVESLQEPTAEHDRSGQPVAGLLESLGTLRVPSLSGPSPVPGAVLERDAGRSVGPGRAAEARRRPEEGVYFLEHRQSVEDGDALRSGGDAAQLAGLLEARARRWVLHGGFGSLREALAASLASGPGATSGADRLEDLSKAIEYEGLEPTAGELATLLARLDVDVDPTWFEDDEGLARVWPPHPSQVTSTEPVAPEDCVAHLRAHLERLAELGHPSYTIDGASGARTARAARLWAVSGAVAGLAWDGRSDGGDDPLRPGAYSLLLEDGSGWDAGELLAQARSAFEQGATRRYWGHLDFAALDDGGRRSRRPLGLELHFGFVRPVALQFEASLEVRPGANTAEIEARVRARLRAFLSTGVLHLGARPEASADRREGPAWAPGREPDRESLERLLLDIDQVERVAFVLVTALRGDGESSGGRLRPFEVPDLERLDFSRIGVVSASGGSSRG